MATPPQKESRANALAWPDDMTYDLRQSLPPRDSVTTPRKEKLSLSLQQRERGDAHSLFDQSSVPLNPGSQGYHYDLLTIRRAESRSLMPPWLHGRYRLAGRALRRS
jgi:hypothetical protein